MLGNVGSNPQYNLITGNRIGQHTTYGIMDYHNANGLDGFNQISDNYIENIQGTTRPGGGTSASGAGIYIAGAGGDSIKGNIVRNCCVQTTFRSLVPAGIAVTLGPAGQAPVNVIGNTVEGMTKWDGICVASSANGANIVGNMVRMPANTTGSAAINILGSSNVVCTDNAIDITPVTGTTVDGIDVNLTTSQNNVVISNNRITGGNARGIYITSGGAPTLTTATISGNILSGSGGGANGIDVMNLIGVTITGNNVNTTTNKALNIATCTQTRVSNNVLITTGTTAVATSGTCTGSILDESNYLSSSAGTQLNAVSNAGTLLNMRQLGTIAPTSGTQILGDVVYSTTGVSPFALWCTAAGSPGTFTGLTIP
jgi:parallel beta-helix repeat protein